MASVKTYHEQLLVPNTSSAKSHKIIQLPNGLLVLLISDPAEDLASLALSVAAGAHNDPDDIPGLAHFCEHLLLLGSKNYPNPNKFHDCLTKAGGRRNAFTTGEKTCYFFEVPSSSTHTVNNVQEPVFNHLFEIFVDCFKNPSFNESMFEKEVYAIDNEHTANKSSTGRILYHGLRLISNDKHPFHRFATGSFFTLNDLPKFKKLKVKPHLIDYYKSNYVAENMVLVVRSSQSLNLLTKLVIQNFSDLPNSNSSKKKSKLKLFGKASDDTKSTNSFDTHRELSDFNILSRWDYDTQAFTSEQARRCILIDSSNNPVVRLLFPYQETKSPETDLLVSAWCNIVGDEGEGSLDEFLKKKGYSVALSAFSQNLSRGSSTLVIEIGLTNTGVKNIVPIISTILNSFKTSVFENVKELGRFLFELESIDLLNYYHQGISQSPMDEASRYAQTLMTDLKVLSPENILKGSSNWNSQYNLGTEKGDIFWFKSGQKLAKFVDDVFTLSNLRFVAFGEIQSLRSSFGDGYDEMVAKTDQNFSFDYSLGRFNPDIFGTTDTEVDHPFNIMKRNPFIPKYALDHLKLQKLLEESANKSSEAALLFTTRNSWTSTKANLHLSTSSLEVWTKVENLKIFNSKLFISFDIVLLDAEPSPENTMMTEIVAELLKLKISNKLYSSELVNYTWEIQASVKGDVRFGFTISGYTDGIYILLNLIIDEFKKLCEAAAFSIDEFRKSRVAVRSRYNLLNQNDSLTMAISGLLVVLEENMWTLEDRIDSLDDIDLDSFKSFLKQFEGNDEFTKVLIQGDFEEIDPIIDSINKLSNPSNTTKSVSFKEPSTYSIKPGKSYKIERNGAENNPMNSISFFIETGPRNDYYADKMTRLISYLMSLTLVPDLRFKKQLGYAVLGGTRTLRTTYGIHISIMSATFTPQYLEDKINEYLSSWGKTFSAITDEEEFRTVVIEPYAKNLKSDLSKSGGPESLTAEMPASVSSSNVDQVGESMKLHKQVRDLISAGCYHEKEISDEEFFANITRSDFLRFFETKILNKFNSRSQLSIMIKSQMSPEETQQQLIYLQLEAFLKMNGLRISSEKLKEVVEESKGNPVILLKDLFKYFLSQGESFKLLATVLKEVVKQVVESVKHYKSNYSDSLSSDNTGDTLSKSEKIEDIKLFQQQNPVYLIHQ